MKRKLAVLLAVFALATAAFAMPAASAGGHLQGELEITLILEECPNPNAPGSGVVSWLGTVDLGKHKVGMAFWTTDPPMEVGDTGFVYWEDTWTLFRLPRYEWHPDAMFWAACTPWRVLMDADEAGIVAPSGVGYAAGEITYGKKHFEKYVGGDFFWYGVYTNAEGTEFAGDVWIFPGGMD